MELSKLYLVPAFHHARRWAESGNSDSDTPDVTPCEEKKKSLPKYCKWEVKNSSHRMGQAPVTVKHSGLLLGKLTGPTPERHPYQATYTADKARCALKTMGWMGAFSRNSSPKAGRLLYTYLMESILVSGVLNTQVSPADCALLRRVQGMVAKRCTWAGRRVSGWIILRELGWTAIDYTLWGAKLNLWEVIKDAPPHEYAHTIRWARAEAINNGSDNQGLAFEARSLWAKAGDPDGWNVTHNWGKSRRRRLIKELVRKIEASEADEILNELSARNGNYALLAPPLRKPASHLTNGTKIRIALMISMRAGACCLRGNKVARRDATARDRACTACYNPTLLPENEAHVTLVCLPYAIPRGTMLTSIRSLWSLSQTLTFNNSSIDQQKLFLLGLPFPNDPVSVENDKKRDLAVKEFLVEVDNIRQSLSLPRLRNAYSHILDFSLEEALDAEQIAADARTSLADITEPLTEPPPLTSTHNNSDDSDEDADTSDSSDNEADTHAHADSQSDSE